MLRIGIVPGYGGTVNGYEAFRGENMAMTRADTFVFESLRHGEPKVAVSDRIVETLGPDASEPLRQARHIVDTLMEYPEEDTFILMAHSWGCMPAIAVPLLMQGRIEKIVLLNPAGLKYIPAWVLIPRVFGMFGLDMFRKNGPSYWWYAITKYLLPNPVRSIKEALQAGMPVFNRAFQDSTVPIVFGIATDDEVFSAESARARFAWLRAGNSSRFRLVEYAGKHGEVYRRPWVVVDALLANGILTAA